MVVIAYALAINHAATASGLYGRTGEYPYSWGFLAVMGAVACIGAALAATGIKPVKRTSPSRVGSHRGRWPEPFSVKAREKIETVLGNGTETDMAG